MLESRNEIERYRDLLRKDPRSRVFAPLAEACRRAGLLEEALRVAQKGVKNHPRYASGRVALARVLIALGRHAEAARELEAALQEAPTNALGFRLLGETRAKLGDPNGALDAFARALAVNPEDEDARRGMRALDALVRPAAGTVTEGAEESDASSEASIASQEAGDLSAAAIETAPPPAAEQVADGELRAGGEGVASPVETGALTQADASVELDLVLEELPETEPLALETAPGPVEPPVLALVLEPVPSAEWGIETREALAGDGPEASTVDLEIMPPVHLDESASGLIDHAVEDQPEPPSDLLMEIGETPGEGVAEPQTAVSVVEEGAPGEPSIEAAGLEREEPVVEGPPVEEPPAAQALMETVAPLPVELPPSVLEELEEAPGEGVAEAQAPVSVAEEGAPGEPAIEAAVQEQEEPPFEGPPVEEPPAAQALMETAAALPAELPPSVLEELEEAPGEGVDEAQAPVSVAEEGAPGESSIEAAGLEREEPVVEEPLVEAPPVEEPPSAQALVETVAALPAELPSSVLEETEEAPGAGVAEAQAPASVVEEGAPEEPAIEATAQEQEEPPVEGPPVEEPPAAQALVETVAALPAELPSSVLEETEEAPGKGVAEAQAPASVVEEGAPREPSVEAAAQEQEEPPVEASPVEAPPAPHAHGVQMDLLDIEHSSLAPEAQDLPEPPEPAVLASPGPLGEEAPSIEGRGEPLVDTLVEASPTTGEPTIAEILASTATAKTEETEEIEADMDAADEWTLEDFVGAAAPSGEEQPEACEEEPATGAPEPEEEKEELVASLDLRTETLADLFVRQGHPERARAIYRAILADDPLHLRVRKKLVDLGPPPPPTRAASAAGDPTVRRKVEENIETLNRWLANIRKGAHQ
jgi:hypothetical protein